MRTIKSFKIFVEFTNKQKLILNSKEIPDNVADQIYTYIMDYEIDNQSIKTEARLNKD
tara:strand:- start:313 stop:486 length:174 start_codon:yes stop_codon:yes gene_type:complete